MYKIFLQSGKPLDSDLKFATESLLLNKKNYLIIILSSFFSLAAVSQSNNPFDAEGITAVKNAAFMQTEMKSGKISSPDQAVIEKYNNLLHIGTLSTVSEITTQTFETVTKPGFEANSFIKNTNIPSRVKKELLSIMDAASVNSLDNFRNFLIKKVDLIKAAADITQADREMILKLCSVSYHSTELQFKDGNNVGGKPTALGCMAAGFGIGYTVGSLFGAGPLGGAIGAGVGLIVGICIEIS